MDPFASCDYVVQFFDSMYRSSFLFVLVFLFFFFGFDVWSNGPRVLLVVSFLMEVCLFSDLF